MELTNFTDVATEVTEVGESIDFAIDQESLGILFKGFSDGLYSNKIGSIVREITSNCFDSHIEAGVTRPVTIEMLAPDPYTGTAGNISFIDYGIGLSPDRVKNIYSKYFASTKRTTNSQIGGFGIGAKSPLSYTESFMAITRYDGTEYTYVIHRGLKVPQVQLVEKNTTNTHNGTEIRIPIKNRADFDRFREEIQEQLMFFDNINYVNCDVDNNYKIYQGKHFIVRLDKHTTEEGRSEPCICLGKVKYPIDWRQISYNSYVFNSPVALRFDIGELTVTMNRESIEYTDKVKAQIQEKFNLVTQELEEIARNSMNEVESFEKYLELADTRRPMLELGKDNYVPVEGFVTTNTFVFKEFKDFPRSFVFPKSNPLFQFEISGLMTGSGSLKLKTSYHETISKLIKKGATLYRVNGSLGKRKSLYIHSLVGNYYVVRKVAAVDVAKTLGFGTGTMVTVDVLKACEVYTKVVLKYLVEHSESYDRTEVDDAWLQTYLENLQEGNGVKDKTELYFKNLTVEEDYHGDSGSFRENRMQYSDFIKDLRHGQMLVYGNSNDHDKLVELGNIVFKMKPFANRDDLNNKVIKIIKISNETIKYISKLPQAIYVDDAYKKLHKHISLLYLTRKFTSSYVSSPMFSKIIHTVFKRVAPMYDEIEEATSRVFRSGGNIMQSVNTYIDTEGIHPAVKHLFTYLDIIIDWADNLLLLRHLNDSLRYSLGENDALIKAMKEYSKRTHKSILNY